MDSAGDKKRIRALFSELSLEDQSAAPRFDELWRRAQTTTPDSRLRPSLMLLVSALALVALCSFALWSRYRSAQPAQVVISPTPPMPHAPEQDKAAFATERKSPRQFQKKVARQRKIQRSVQDMAMLSKWQSPTVSFLQPPVSPVFESLPQLDQSARELKSFLPNNDVKEIRQ
jgi:hypothetical protein